MASFVSELLFNSRGGQHRREESSCHATPAKRFRSMFGQSFHGDSGVAESGIHPGPPPPQQTPSSLRARRVEALGGVPPYLFATLPDIGLSDETRHNRFSADGARELLRCQVVNENDAQRGFRMFDGILMSVKDVSSEELFLERMRIAYAAYDTYVAVLPNGSPLDLTTALVRALSACITKYFTTQSVLRTNRPFIAKVLHLDCPDMFCAHSDFTQAFLFTNASAEDEAIIALAENVYAENNFNVCSDFTDRQSFAAENHTELGGAAINPTTETDRLFELGMRIAESSVMGGTHPSFGVRRDPTTGDTNPFADNLPFTQRRNTAHGPDTNSAMLIVVTDFEALHNYVSYALYLTPAQLSRRYTVNFDSLRRPSSVHLDCARSREAKSSRKRDSAKAAIRAVIEKKRRDKIDTMGERSEACEAVLAQRAVQTVERNNDVLRHVLLMLFDKCLSTLIDRGFENLNARRGYAVNSSKEIGAATIYTGIIDTVGEVSTNLEGCTFENVVAGKEPGEQIQRFAPPPNSITAESVSESTLSAPSRAAER